MHIGLPAWLLLPAWTAHIGKWGGNRWSMRSYLYYTGQQPRYIPDKQKQLCKSDRDAVNSPYQQVGFHPAYTHQGLRPQPIVGNQNIAMNNSPAQNSLVWCQCTLTAPPVVHRKISSVKITHRAFTPLSVNSHCWWHCNKWTTLCYQMDAYRD